MRSYDGVCVVSAHVNGVIEPVAFRTNILDRLFDHGSLSGIKINGFAGHLLPVMFLPTGIWRNSRRSKNVVVPIDGRVRIAV